MAAIEITVKIGCSINCAYCPQEKLLTSYAKRSKVFDLSFDTFKTCIDKVSREVDVIFSGMCEPFLNPECARMILYAHKKGHKIAVDSTLVGMQLSDIEVLQNIPFRYFSVHLPSGQGYENMRVDENYLMLLDRISKSRIKTVYKFHGEGVHPKIEPIIKKNNINWSYTVSRAGNMSIKGRSYSSRLQGVIKCKRLMRWNILLPNGDVVLCSSDYGMQHVLGNLLSSDYDSLFRSEEFLKVKTSLSDDSLDTLCRHCDTYSYKVGFLATPFYYWRKIFNNTRSLKDFLHFAKKYARFLKIR